MLMIIASIGAVAVFVAVLSYVSSVRAQVGDFRNVLQLKQDVPANASVTESMVEVHQVPKKWLGGNFITDKSELEGKVAVKELSKGSYLNDGMIAEAPELQSGQREIAILIDAETGVAGKVRPGSLVDIYATFTSANQGQKTCAVRVLANARVINVGQTRSQRDEESGSRDLQAVVPVTFALSPTDSLTLTYAESAAQQVRLALVGPGETTVPDKKSVCDAPIS